MLNRFTSVMKFLLLPFAASLAALATTPAFANDSATPARIAGDKPTADPAPSTVLDVGATVTPQALAELEWIRGEAPAAWEPGKLYILECWATWCGPCIAAIPKLNELHANHEAKGLRIIGVNVWEDGIDKVREFVASRGDGMSYPIAYTGRGGAFETAWLTPAGVRGIPHAFVVRDGTLLLKTHPSYLTDEVITGLLADTEAAEAALESIHERIRQRDEISSALRAFNQAANSRDLPIMEASLDKAIAAGADPAMIRSARADLAITRLDWPGLESVLDEITPDDPNGLIALHTVLRRLDATDEAPADVVRRTLAAFDPHVTRLQGPVEFHTLASLEWRIGNPERALERIRLAAELAADARNARVGVPASYYQRIAKAFKDGTPPSRETTSEWLREALQQRAATAPESP